VSAKDSLVRVIDRLAGAGALPDDGHDLRLRKGILTLFASLMTAMGTVWVITYWALGHPGPALVPLSYQAVSLASLLLFFRTKRYRFFRASQLSLALLLPFLFQIALGGYRSGSAVVVWSFTAPLGALMFLGARQAIGWFLAFIALVATAGGLEGTLSSNAPDIPTAAIVSFFVLNVSGVALTTYSLLQYFVRQRDRAMAALAIERERSERLLLNVLPEQVAERLKDDGSAIAERFPDITVLFADIVDFTPLSEGLTPEEVVALLNDVFTAFDQLADRHGLEKIKTIGDAYMVAGGLPIPRPDHAEAVADMALDMQREVALRSSRPGRPLSVRIGIHTGPVVAGVIGRRKFIYDLWGDTVNTASRMESQGLAGTVQVTEETYRRLRDRYEFEARGRVPVKGKGDMSTYLLVGRKSPAVPTSATAASDW
jgi:class 3 adenylate cyclase